MLWVHPQVDIGVGTPARAHVHSKDPLLHLRNGWTDRVQIWCVARDRPAKCPTWANEGVYLHVRTRNPLTPHEMRGHFFRRGVIAILIERADRLYGNFLCT